MTIIDHRCKGVFVELAKNTFELCKLNGIKLLFGFPNQNSYHGLVNNLGWKIAGHMQRFKIPVNTFPFASLLQNFQSSKWIYNKYLKLVLRKYLSLDNFTGSAITEEYGGVYRDENYMRYKQYNSSLLLKIFMLIFMLKGNCSNIDIFGFWSTLLQFPFKIFNFTSLVTVSFGKKNNS